MPGADRADTVGAGPDPLALAAEAASVLAGRTGVARHRIAVILGTGLDSAFGLVGRAARPL